MFFEITSLGYVLVYRTPLDLDCLHYAQWNLGCEPYVEAQSAGLSSCGVSWLAMVGRLSIYNDERLDEDEALTRARGVRLPSWISIIGGFKSVDGHTHVKSRVRNHARIAVWSAVLM